MPDTTRDTTEGDTARQCATITEAARILRVSVRTVQRRLDSGELQPIQRDGKRLVQLPASAAKTANPDATARQADTPPLDTALARSTPDLAAQLAQSREEVLFLRGLVEQRDRDAAELRAALREALKAMPEALEAGGKVSRETEAPEATPSNEIAPRVEIPAPTKQIPQTGRKREIRPLQRALARLIGLRIGGLE